VVQSPKDLAKKSDRGNIVHADMSISQMGALRPIRSMSGYKTPVGHLWHTAAGAHPMGALNGWSGRTTGRMVDRIIRRAKDEPAAGYSAYVRQRRRRTAPTARSPRAGRQPVVPEAIGIEGPEWSATGSPARRPT